MIRVLLCKNNHILYTYLRIYFSTTLFVLFSTLFLHMYLFSPCFYYFVLCFYTGIYLVLQPDNLVLSFSSFLSCLIQDLFSTLF